MKWLPLLWTALRRKPARTVYTLLSIVIAFLLVGIMSGLNAAFAERIADARIDRIVVTARYGVWYPIAYVDQIARMDGVSEIVPAAFIEASYQEPANRLFIRMTDPRARSVLPELNVTPDLMTELERVQDGLIVSRGLADRLRMTIGARVPLETDRVFQDGTRTWGFNVLAIVP